MVNKSLVMSLFCYFPNKALAVAALVWDDDVIEPVEWDVTATLQEASAFEDKAVNTGLRMKRKMPATVENTDLKTCLSGTFNRHRVKT